MKIFTEDKFLKLISLFIVFGVFFWGIGNASGTTEGFLEINKDLKIAGLEKRISELESKINYVTSDLKLVENTISNKQDAASATASRGSLQNDTEDMADVIAKINPSVVSISSEKESFLFKSDFNNLKKSKSERLDPTKTGIGTGFIISSQGHILTNRHVIEENENYFVTLIDGTKKKTKTIYKDDNFDIAIIKVEGEFIPLELGDSTIVRVGQPVIAIGNALGTYNNTVSTGVISGLDRSIRAFDDEAGTSEILYGVIQTDASINRGNSGGPLITADGKVIGINVATVLGSNNVSFALPINLVKPIIEEVL